MRSIRILLVFVLIATSIAATQRPAAAADEDMKMVSSDRGLDRPIPREATASAFISRLPDIRTVGRAESVAIPAGRRTSTAGSSTTTPPTHHITASSTTPTASIATCARAATAS